MTRKLICTLLAAVLLATAMSAAGCGRGEDAPVNVYREQILKLPDGVMAYQLKLMDDGVVFFDIETETVIFADYNGEIQREVDLNLSESEYLHSLDIDEENGCTYIHTSQALYTIDRAGNLSREATDEAPEAVYRISEDKLELIRDAINLADYNEKESELIDVRFMPGGDIICAFHDGGFIARDIIRYKLIDPNEPPDPADRTIVTVYALGFEDYLNDWLKNLIRDFNRSNAWYTIELKFFLNDSIDHEAALRNLNTAITAGDIPDIIIYDNMMSVKKHADSGLLVDLYEIMAGDPDFNEKDYLPNAFTASELEGKLYSIFPSFDVVTTAARTSDVGEGMGWTLDEFAQFVSRSGDAYISAYFGREPKGIFVTSQEEFLVDMSYKLFVDSVTGEVDFDRSVFMKLLEIAEYYPPETVDITYSGIFYDRSIGPEGPLMWLDNAGGFYHTSLIVRRFFVEDFIYKGYPGVGGSGSFFDPLARLAITEQSVNKDGAWTFIRYLLDNCDYVYPVNINLLERNAEKSKRDFPITFGSPDNDDTETRIYDGIIEEDITTTMELIKSLDHVLLYDQTITAIIGAEIKSYLAGQCTAEQAADVIESKLEVYYAESS